MSEEDRNNVEIRIRKMKGIIERGDRQKEKRKKMTSGEKRAVKHKKRIRKEKIKTN